MSDGTPLPGSPPLTPEREGAAFRARFDHERMLLQAHINGVEMRYVAASKLLDAAREELESAQERAEAWTEKAFEVEEARNALAAENAALREALDELQDHHCAGITWPESEHLAMMTKVNAALESPSSAADSYTRSIKRAERERCAEEAEGFPGGDFRPIADAIRALGDEP